MLFYKMIVLFDRIQDHPIFLFPHSLSFGEQWELAFTMLESICIRALWFSYNSVVRWFGALPSPFAGNDERRTVVFGVGRCPSQQTHPDPAHHVPTKGPREVTGDAPGALVSLGEGGEEGPSGIAAGPGPCVWPTPLMCVNLPEREKCPFPVRCWHWAFINTATGEGLTPERRMLP